MSQVNSKTGTLDLDQQDQIGLQTSTVFEKNELYFITPSNLNCALIIYWFQAGGALGVGGGRHLFFCEYKKKSSLVCSYFEGRNDYHLANK